MKKNIIVVSKQLLGSNEKVKNICDLNIIILMKII